jgi:predicted nucleic acid-binding protein
LVVLDTNVLSALMRERPDDLVRAWLDTLPSESVWTTAITVFEIRFGIARLAPGRRRERLDAAFTSLLHHELDGRILSFDEAAAGEAAGIAAAARAAGRPVEVQDLQIAGIVRARRATLATRNIRHFDDAGIPLADPWAAAG